MSSIWRRFICPIRTCLSFGGNLIGLAIAQYADHVWDKEGGVLKVRHILWSFGLVEKGEVTRLGHYSHQNMSSVQYSLVHYKA